MIDLGIHLAEWGLAPDAAIRAGIRRLLARRLAELERAAGADPAAFERAFAERLKTHALAEDTPAANRQHYEVPTAFFQQMLGPRLKYSAAWYNRPDTSLGEAEEAMLALSAERAGLADGMQILELGCGWGSWTLWMAERFPRAHITAVTNSATQAAYVNEQARTRGLGGVHVLRNDVNTFLSDQTFDRIVSVEMFEHVRNYEQLFGRLGQWLRPDGKLFVHVFSHRRFPYLFETEGADNWMGRHFFTGGTMPSHGLLPLFDARLRLEEAWQIDGRHYARTLEDWLVRLDRHRPQALAALAGLGGPWARRVALQRWRMFLMACAELFGYAEGAEWGVSHYRFAPRVPAPTRPDPARAADRRDASPR